MLNEYEEWVKKNNFRDKINETNYLKYFNEFILGEYQEKIRTTKEVVIDILQEIYILSLNVKKNILDIEMLKNVNGAENILEKFFKEIFDGQEDEESDEEDCKCRKCIKESRKGQSKTC